MREETSLQYYVREQKFLVEEDQATGCCVVSSSPQLQALTRKEDGAGITSLSLSRT